mmetsp:Transcript_34484/g.65659  ORF Transcript_34484/g.65659 Transcript_34484/m.65659 type:complete len:120 (-) Transcript_34484:1221-1580(-)
MFIKIHKITHVHVRFLKSTDQKYVSMQQSLASKLTISASITLHNTINSRTSPPLVNPKPGKVPKLVKPYSDVTRDSGKPPLLLDTAFSTSMHIVGGAPPFHSKLHSKSTAIDVPAGNSL